MDSSIGHRTPVGGAIDTESRRHALDLLLARLRGFEGEKVDFRFFRSGKCLIAKGIYFRPWR